jgi:PAS domain-containing protein
MTTKLNKLVKNWDLIKITRGLKSARVYSHPYGWESHVLMSLFSVKIKLKKLAIMLVVVSPSSLPLQTGITQPNESLKCQAENKNFSFTSSEAKQIAFLLTPLMMWQIDNNGNVLTANQLFLDFLGASPDDELNLFDPAIVSPSDYKSCCAAFAKGKSEKSPFVTTRGLKSSDGKFYTYTAKVYIYTNRGYSRV